MFNTFTITDTNNRLLEALKVFISNNFIIKHWDKDNNTQKDNSLKTSKEREIFLDVIQFQKPNRRRIKATQKDKTNDDKIFYSLPMDTEVIFTYNNNTFKTLLQGKNEIVEFPSGILKPYQTLIIKTNCTKTDFDNFIKDAIKFYDVHYSRVKDIELCTQLMVFSDGYWENLGFKNQRKMSTIYLSKDIITDLKEDINKFNSDETKTLYENLGIPYKRNYLFEGLPGTGKTSLIQGIATMCSKDISMLSFNDKFTDISLMRAIKNMPDDSILVMEDIDALFQERKKNDDRHIRITFSGLLNALDGLNTKDGLIVIMTTNHKINLDDALIRPGRVDKVVTFTYATNEQIEDMFTNFTKPKNDEIVKKFINKFKSLNLNITTAILQQYLIQYLNDPENAINNIENIKQIIEQVPTSNSSSNLYI